METTKEKVSYCIGLETGKNLKQQFSDMDVSLLSQGIQDALSDTPPRLSTEEIRSILVALRNQIQSQQKQFVTKLSEQNKQEGEAFLSKNKSGEGIVALSNGLQYRVLKQGSGNKPSLFDVVEVHYKGSFINGKVFDSSYDRGAPQALPVSRLIPGWSEALQLMQVGDKWQLYIPSYLAYGEQGFGPDIGPNCTLIFELELLSINPAPKQ